MADQAADRRTLRFLTVIDDFTRRGLWIECSRHLTSVDVVRVPEPLVELHGTPTTIKSDNVLSLVSRAFCAQSSPVALTK